MTEELKIGIFIIAVIAMAIVDFVFFRNSKKR